MVAFISFLILLLVVTAPGQPNNRAFSQQPVRNVELTGVLNMIWNGGPQYILTDSNTGEQFTLELDEELTREQGGPLKLNRKEVQITGNLNPATNIVTVSTIDAVEGTGTNLTGNQTAAGNQTTNLTGNQTAAGNQSTAVGLTGVLNTIWPHIGPNFTAYYPAEPIYILTDNNTGEQFTLELDEELTREQGGPLKLNRKEVQITGNLNPAIGRVDPFGNIVAPPAANLVTVSTIDVVDEETPPVGSSHLLGAHVSGPQRWVTILCRFGDSTTVTPRPTTFFEDLMNNMDIYWRELSYENANLVGSTVVGWFNMPQARADYLDGPGGQLNHAEIAEDCTAAADAFVNFPDYLGINLMFNQDLDCCSWGGSSVLNRDGISRIYSITWMATWGWGNHNVMGHEMGHGFGLPHSSGPYTATYDSQWDVMSGGGTCSPPDPTFGCLGVHTIGFHKDALGWIPDSRRYMATTGPDQSVFIERLAQPGTSGYLVAQIPIGGSTTNFYTVEARKFVGFDQQVPGEAIVIHLVDTIRGDRLAQVVDVDSIPNSNPNDDGAMWLPGEVFTDTVNNIAIAVIEDTGSGYRIIINPTNRPPVADNQAITTHQNIPQAITLTASDPDGDTIIYSVVTNPSAGTLSSLNPPAGTVTYTPNTNYFGPDSFTFKAADSGGADSNTATVSIVVKGVPNCDGATIVGNDNRNDVLQGTSGDDVIAGLGGNDVIYGNGGHDIICGGNGNDYLDGGAGDDQVNGEAGNDRVSGREGNNELYGREGNDFLDSGAGNDFLIGESGNDFLDSGAGNDELYGREGNDFINGGPNNDIGDGGPNQDSCINVETRSNCEG